MKKLINWYSKKFNVALDEAFIPPGGFRNFDEFFTRNLKRGMRSVHPHPIALVSPVDAMVSACGSIKAGQLIQAKGINYDVASLLPGQFQSYFISGSFITLYLSPGDYHRIHSPVSGTIVGYQYDPGKLYTVQDWLVKILPGLFTVNERITSYIQSAFGLVAVCKVGAMNVGRISLSYAPVYTNQWCAKPYFYRFDESKRPKISKGNELGIFHLGSTVIVVTQKPVSFLPNIEGSKVQMGQAIGYF
jgi:phosphatidylserine decarboxylase